MFPRRFNAGVNHFGTEWQSVRSHDDPGPDGLSHANHEADGGPKELDRLQMLAGDGKNQGFKFVERIRRDLVAHQTAHVKFGNRGGQSLARRDGNLFNQRFGGALDGVFRQVIAQPANGRDQQTLDLRTQDTVYGAGRIVTSNQRQQTLSSEKL